MKSNFNTKQRILKDRSLFWGVCILSALTAIPLIAILGEVFIRGYEQFTWTFFTEPTPTAYKAMKAVNEGQPIPGGIANGII
ncbi:MAG: phosphate ABC transporter, permease protein PstA, partial [Bacteroidales bacterium]|nr:phosphate ABC transporter, permease protein PstA [Bacteroidales bacterium]